MAERKRIQGEDGADYLGAARNLLAALKQSMALNKLMVLSRTVTFGEATITVSSVYGQDDITITAPPTVTEQLQGKVDDLVEAVDKAKLNGKFEDFVQLFSQVRLTVQTSTSGAPTPPPYYPPNIGGGDDNSSEIDIGLQDFVQVTNSITITLVTTTQNEAPPLPPAPSQIFIGGRDTGNGNPAIWDDVGGARALGVRNGLGQGERNAVVLGFSPDGKLPFGSVEVYDNSVNPALTNPFTGAQQPYGYVTQACVWRNGTRDSDVMRWNSGESSEARKMDANGTVHGLFSRVTYTGSLGSTPVVYFNGGFRWNGYAGSGPTTETTAPPVPSLTSSNGRVKVSGNKYSLDNGPWIQFANQYFSAACVLHIPYTPPANPPPPPIVTTTTLVFSG